MKWLMWFWVKWMTMTWWAGVAYGQIRKKKGRDAY